MISHESYNIDDAQGYPMKFVFLQLFLLEEIRERKFDAYARVIQKAFRKYNATKHFVRLRQQGKDFNINHFEGY